MLEYLDTVREQRTGITRYSQGMDADSLNKTATGVNTILSQAQMRVELIARIFAETGVKDMFLKMFELVVKHQDKERIIKIRNNFVPFRPMEWRNRCNISISVGLGTGSRDQQLSILNNILQTQLKGLELQGSSAGPMVNLRNIYNTLSKIVENAGPPLKTLMRSLLILTLVCKTCHHHSHHNLQSLKKFHSYKYKVRTIENK